MNEIMPQEVLSKSERALQKRVEKLDKVGVTDERLFKKVLEGIDAGEEEETLVDGKRVIKTKPNLLLQHKWTETALRMKGHLIPVEIKNEVSVDNRKNIINITTEDGERLMAIARRLEELNSRLEMGQSGEVIDAIVD